jgi:hypothetical protein
MMRTSIDIDTYEHINSVRTMTFNFGGTITPLSAAVGMKYWRLVEVMFRLGITHDELITPTVNGYAITRSCKCF